jgi:hypothetical protein
VATASALIEEVLDLFYQDHRPQFNILTTTVDASETTLVFTDDLRSIATGAFIEIGTEVMLVRATSTNSVTVVRGMRGSTAAAHTAGDLVTVNPRLTRHSIFRSLNEELHALHAAGLYVMNTVELQYNPSVQGYNLTGLTNLTDIYAVSYEDIGPEDNWPEIPRSQYRLVRNAETDDFASGMAIVLYHGGNPGRQLRIMYKAPFTQFANEAATTTTAGLPDSAVDLLPLGVVLRLGSFREWSRNSTTSQGDSRRAGEVQPGAMGTALRPSLQYRQIRLTTEVNQLSQKYPEVRR